MEHILDELDRRLDAVTSSSAPESIRKLKSYQRYVRKLDEYYQSDEWKTAYDMDQKGLIPISVKRGVLSEDGIYNALMRNSEILNEIEGDTHRC